MEKLLRRLWDVLEIFSAIPGNDNNISVVEWKRKGFGRTRGLHEKLVKASIDFSWKGRGKSFNI